SSSAVNGTVFREAQQRNILCNAVDDPKHCDFYYGAVVRRGQLQVAISTEGQSPALAQRIRRELEVQFGPEYAGWVEELGQIRERLFASGIDPESRRQLLHELASRDAFAERERQPREESYGRISLSSGCRTGRSRTAYVKSAQRFERGRRGATG